MSRSNWLPKLEVVGVIAIAALLAVTFGRLATQRELIGSPGSEQRYQYSEQHNGDARAWAPIPFNVTKEPGTYTADCQNPKDHEEADLCQQWRAAKAAEKAADLAETQAYWNWLQLVGVFATVAAAWAAVIAARAAQISVAVAQDTANKQLRAYVLIDDTEITDVKENEARWLRGKIIMKNSGITPATNVRHWIGMCIKPHPLREDFPPPAEKPAPTCAIGGGGQFISPFGRQFTDDEWAAVISGEHFRFHVFGRIEYDHIGGKSDGFPYALTLGYDPYKMRLCLVWRSTDHGSDKNIGTGENEKEKT